jgi:hypothetical protein
MNIGVAQPSGINMGVAQYAASAPAGYGHKVLGVTPAKVAGVTPTKVVGV